MATKEQIAANRKNATKSTGPRTATGKAATKFNGLKHGLRANEVVLPGEDPDAFQEHLDAWIDDWKPATMARRALVEETAVAAWRKRRCVRVETARLSARMRGAYAAWDRSGEEDVDRLMVELRRVDPRATLPRLLATRAGIDRLIKYWHYLIDAASAPEGWDDAEDHHMLLFALCGYFPGDPGASGMKEASWRLFLRNAPPEMIAEDDPEPPGDAEAEAVCGQIRSIGAERVEVLRGMRPGVPDDAAARDRHAERVAFEPRPEDAALLRYEAQLTRQFHKGLDGLVKLARTGADLVEADPEAEAPTGANPADVDDGEGVAAGSPGRDLGPAAPMTADASVGTDGDEPLAPMPPPPASSGGPEGPPTLA